MDYQNKPDPNRLQIYHEGRKRRIYVGELIYNKEKEIYELIYDKKYVRSKSAIPLGPELDLFKLKHQTEKNKLFSSLLDRIPEKSNPAYPDYCKSQGISPDEKNPIILLGTIGKRGPSSFIFEPVYHNEFDAAEITKFREKLNISQHDLAIAFDIKKSTLQRIESGASHEYNTLQRIQMLLEFPEVALWQLKLTGARLHSNELVKLLKYFEEKLEK